MRDPNENRSGYKETKVGWIPEDWRVIQLRDLGVITSGNTPSRQNSGYFDGGRFPWVKTTDLNNGIIFSTEECITPLAIEKAGAKMKPSGSVLVAMYGGYKQIDRTGVLGFEAAVNQAISVLPPSKKFSSLFVQCALNANVGMWRRFAGSSRKDPNITREDVCSFWVPFPGLNEQQEIAHILSTSDEVIEKTADLIKAKKRQKKALMQQLLTGKKRLPDFEGEWNEVILGDLVKPISTPVPKPKKPYVAVGIRSHGKGTFHRNVENPEKVAMDTLYRVEPGDLVVNITFAWEGAIALVKECDAVGYVSHRFPTFRPKSSADIDFLKYLVISQRFIWDLGLVSPGGAGRNRVMNKKDFLRIRLFVPCREEQKVVASVLNAADAELVVIESKLEALKQQKKALMQKLLTGQVRVKV